MANAKIIEQKAGVVSEIKEKLENAKSVVMFDYRGLSVAEVTELRRKLREAGADYKVYKNTLLKRALDEVPQSAAGKTIMTTEPKFVPSEAALISAGDSTARIRMIELRFIVFYN